MLQRFRHTGATTYVPMFEPLATRSILKWLRPKEKIWTRTVFPSFLLGLGVGVAIGMLFAPKSGDETRELIKNKAGEGGEFLKQRGSELKDTASGWVDKGQRCHGPPEGKPQRSDGGRQAGVSRRGQLIAEGGQQIAEAVS